jgi:hypothetical protein
LFCDLELHGNPSAPQIVLAQYVDDIIARADAGLAKRVFENDSRIMRIAKASPVVLPGGAPGLALLITLGDRRGADPSFVHFEEGNARDAEKFEGEVKGFSAHCVLRISDDNHHPGRHRFLMEEVQGIGRTQMSRLLQHVLRQISSDRNERFQNPETGRMNKLVPVLEVLPRQSNAMLHALQHGVFQPVELIDHGAQPAFDANPEFVVRRHNLFVKAKPAVGRTIRQVFNDLKNVAKAEGYDRMRVVWRIPGSNRGGTAEIDTDVADVGTAMFAHRVLVEVDHPMSDCAADLNDEFLAKMIEQF